MENYILIYIFIIIVLIAGVVSIIFLLLKPKKYKCVEGNCIISSDGMHATREKCLQACGKK